MLDDLKMFFASLVKKPGSDAPQGSMIESASEAAENAASSVNIPQETPMAEVPKTGFQAVLAKALGQSQTEERPVFTPKATYEINLVPEVKGEMIRMLRVRNLVLFACIVFAGAAIGITAILGSIVGGQAAVVEAKNTQINNMSAKLNDFDSISEFLTFQNQSQGIENVTADRKLLSRVFTVLNGLLPHGSDTISLSELNIDMDNTTLQFDAQADAGVEPFIDYRVLESFKKSVALMKYDYGHYVDAEGNEYPSRCIIEAWNDGNTFVTEDRQIYAYAMLGKYGCELAAKERTDALIELDEETRLDDTVTDADYKERKKEIYEAYDGVVTENWFDEWLKDQELERYDDLEGEQHDEMMTAYTEWFNTLEDDEKEIVQTQVDSGVDIKDVNFVKIYRTPLFSEWTADEWTDEDGKKQTGQRMTLSGDISGVPHFESECIRYSGEEMANGEIKWMVENECLLAPEGVNISDSSNGMDAEDNLVLRFTASIEIEPEVFKFENKHMMAISPDGQNVTDSYVQIEGMFEERAEDCSAVNIICTSPAAQENAGVIKEDQ